MFQNTPPGSIAAYIQQSDQHNLVRIDMHAYRSKGIKDIIAEFPGGADAPN
jgi:hypothetical protein